MLLSVENLWKSYDTAPVLNDVSLQLDAGETLALTGESGSGKSTLLHLVGALDGFDKGDITLDGTQYSGLDDAGRANLRREHLALIFQQFNLIPSLTVGQNIRFHARLGGRDEENWAVELTDRLGLSGLEDRYPEMLSGGQQQRVAIGRALATRPRLLLADEPTGNLDGASSGAVLDLMLELVAETRASLFLVTHSEQVAARLDRRLHLTGGALR
ncbi:MAG: ABC transporter ATP-binding protein [Paracoccaceae bacterium]